VLALLGGVVGLALAFGLTDAVRHGPSFIQAMKTLAITPDVAGALLVTAFVIGIVSSFVPAFNASRTPILDSLRNAG